VTCHRYGGTNNGALEKGGTVHAERVQMGMSKEGPDLRRISEWDGYINGFNYSLNQEGE